MIPSIPNLQFSDSNNFFLIAGPCVIENEAIVLQTAEVISTITARLKIPFVFKASYTKANRSKADSFTGIGNEEALAILKKAGTQLQIPVLTDIHETTDAAMAAQFADVLQIPSFLSRQTELLIAAGKTGKFVNIKKGQFLSPDQMQFAAEKISSTGNKNILLTERGSSFGYGDLVVDFRSIPIMKKSGYPVVLDCTHSLQLPNQPGGVSGGMPQLIETIAKAGIAAGADGLFIETHPDPKSAKSDGANMLPLDQLEILLKKLIRIRHAII